MVGALLPAMAMAAQATRYEPVSLCSVFKDPKAYANKKISVHGYVYMGMDHTNISDKACTGQAIELNVGDDVYQHADIRTFHRKITGWQMHGFATVFGTFSVTDSPLTPFTLNVERVANVTQDDK